VLELSRERAVFNIIDGQHRVFGHSLSDRSVDESIPVVVLKSIDTSEQLKLFMDINQNQKKVSAKLRLDLQEDLYYDSKYPSKRMLALTSRVIRQLNSRPSSSLTGQISIGDNSSGKYSSLYFANGIKLGRFLPKSVGLKWSANEFNSVIFDVFEEDLETAMNDGIKRLLNLLERNLNVLLEVVQSSYLNELEHKFINSNRGLLTFLKVLGDVLNHLSIQNKWTFKTQINTISEHLVPISSSYVEYVKKIAPETLKELVSMQGAQVPKEWSLHVNKQIASAGYSDFYKEELTRLSEKEITNIYLILTQKIKRAETLIKKIVIGQMQALKGDTWDASFGELKYESLKRAEQHNDEIRIKNLSEPMVEWHHKLMLIDYRKVVLKNWSTRSNTSGASFQSLFSIQDLTGKSASREDSTKWFIDLNELRNKWAHSGTNNATFYDEDVEFVDTLLAQLEQVVDQVPLIYSV